MVFLIEGLAGLGVASLLVVALAEWGKFRIKAEKGFNWIGLAGVWFLFAGTFAAATNLTGLLTVGITTPLATVFEVVGWLFALVGTAFAAYEVLIER